MIKENKINLINLIMEAAQSRGDREVSEKYIEKALVMIDSGEMKVAMYPTGFPSLKGVYDLALELMLTH